MGLLNAGSSGLVSSLVGYDFMGSYTTASTAAALWFQPVAGDGGAVPTGSWQSKPTAPLVGRGRRTRSAAVPLCQGRAGVVIPHGVPAVGHSVHLNRSVRLDHDVFLMIRQPVAPKISGSIVSTAAQITQA